MTSTFWTKARAQEMRSRPEWCRLSTTVLLAAALLCACLPVACATLETGTAKKVTFTSTPPGAQVVIVSFRDNLHYRVQTPGTIALDRSEHYAAMFELEGHYTQTFPVASTGGGAVSVDSVAGNMLAGGLLLGPLFVAVDLGTGAAFTLPDRVDLEMTPLGQPVPPNVFSHEEAIERVRIEVERQGKVRRDRLEAANAAGPRRRMLKAGAPDAGWVDPATIFEVTPKFKTDGDTPDTSPSASAPEEAVRVPRGAESSTYGRPFLADSPAA